MTARQRRRAAGSKAVVTYLTQVASTVDAASYNFGTITTPRAGLLVIGSSGRTGGGARTISTISIAGSNRTIRGANPSSQNNVGFAEAELAAGNHNVTVTYSGSGGRAAIFAWLVESYSSPTPTDAEAVSSGAATSVANTIDIDPDGVAMFAFMGDLSVAVAFSSATERHDATIETNNRIASADKIGGGAAHVETVSWAGAAAAALASVSYK